MLDLSNEPFGAFVGITEVYGVSGCKWKIYYGYLESYWHSAKLMNCKLELSDSCFADDKTYTPEDVNKIMKPFSYSTFIQQ